MGKPFAMDVAIETKLVQYMIQMQELGFSLTVNQIKSLAFKITESSQKEHPFNKTKEMAGWYGWINFKKDMVWHFSNLGMNRANTANRKILNDFYIKLENLATKLRIKNSTDRFWNVDETELTYVMKTNRIVTLIGKKYVYKQSYAERGLATTVLDCLNATGFAVLPLIFNGIRMVDGLQENSIPGNLRFGCPKQDESTQIYQTPDSSRSNSPNISIEHLLQVPQANQRSIPPEKSWSKVISPQQPM
ncbi:hypothetical protein ILUMI_22379 [Ignelater luminosus]|uniref:Uncharacterized protein n=1 Tax=Ignelater luminosus TaxID=2038154 RepID=A0A8K0CAR5_IGNLU|nr:hypothetical protein ILUMI_22379 [Ignelater luminosus]